MPKGKNSAAEGGQDLRRLERSVSILGICLLIQAIGFIVLA